MDRQDQAGGRGAWRRVHPILQTSLFFEHFCSIITCASMSVCCLEGGGGGGGIRIRFRSRVEQRPLNQRAFVFWGVPFVGQMRFDFERTGTHRANSKTYANQGCRANWSTYASQGQIRASASAIVSTKGFQTISVAPPSLGSGTKMAYQCFSWGRY